MDVDAIVTFAPALDVQATGVLLRRLVRRLDELDARLDVASLALDGRESPGTRARKIAELQAARAASETPRMSTAVEQRLASLEAEMAALRRGGGFGALPRPGGGDGDPAAGGLATESVLERLAAAEARMEGLGSTVAGLTSEVREATSLMGVINGLSSRAASDIASVRTESDARHAAASAFAGSVRKVLMDMSSEPGAAARLQVRALVDVYLRVRSYAYPNTRPHACSPRSGTLTRGRSSRTPWRGARRAWRRSGRRWNHCRGRWTRRLTASRSRRRWR